MLTKIQAQERVRRKRNWLRQRYGVRMAKGTRPSAMPQGEPIFKPSGISPWSFREPIETGLLALLSGLLWWRRGKRAPKKLEK